MSASRLLRCVAVVGPGEVATATAVADAEVVGRLIAERGWVTLTGGRAAGVTAAEAVFGCGVNPGTVSELALRAGNPMAPVGASAAVVAFFAELAAGAPFVAVATPTEAVEWVARALGDVSQ